MPNPSQTDDIPTDETLEKSSKDLAHRLRQSYESMKSQVYEEGFKAGVASMQVKEKQG